MPDEKTYHEHALDQIRRERGERPHGEAFLAWGSFLVAASTSLCVLHFGWPWWLIVIAWPGIVFITQRQRVRHWERVVKEREQRLKFSVRGLEEK